MAGIPVPRCGCFVDWALIVAENEGKKEEEKPELTLAGETLGYISLDQARILAMRTAREAPGDYGRRFRNVPMAFELVEANETEDYYEVTLSLRPQGAFTGTQSQEQFFIEKEGDVAVRQVLSLPEVAGGRHFPVIPAAIGLVVVVIVAVAGVVFATGGGGGDGEPTASVTPGPAISTPLSGVPSSASDTGAPPTETPMATPGPTPTRTPRPTAIFTPVPRPTVIGVPPLGSISVAYWNRLHVDGPDRGEVWQPGGQPHSSGWQIRPTYPLQFSVTTAKPLGSAGWSFDSMSSSSLDAESGEYNYVWASTGDYIGFPLAEKLRADSGLRIRRLVTPDVIQPGENRVSVTAAVEIMRAPTVDGAEVRPMGGILELKLGSSQLSKLGAESSPAPGSRPLRVVQVLGSGISTMPLDPPFDVGREYALTIELHILNPNEFPVRFLPKVYNALYIDPPLGLKTPSGTGAATSAIEFNVRGPVGQELRLAMENPSGEEVAWTFEPAVFGVVVGFSGLTHMWRESVTAESAAPTPTPTATSTPTPTASAVPIPTLTPIPLPTPTPRPVPTSTPLPGLPAGSVVEFQYFHWLGINIDGQAFGERWEPSVVAYHSR